jgi:hypothetical protein
MKRLSVYNELRNILSALTLHSSEHFTFAGVHFSTAQIKLEELLYNHCYAQRFTGTLQQSSLNEMQVPDANWIEELSIHNASRDGYNDGWTIQQVFPNGYVFAQKDTTSQGLWAGEFITKDGGAGPLRPGVRISMRIARESRTAQPGFYFVFGETPADAYENEQVVRFYWNVPARGGPALVKYLSQGLNKYRLPFRFKLPSHPAFYGRTDAGTLYVPRRYWRAAFSAVEDTYRQISPALNPDTPLFTKTIAPGLGFAEDPGTSESFGTVRCRLLSAALWHAQATGVRSEEEWMNAIEDRFEEAGISLAQPWLKAGSRNEYEFEWEG